ncbi:MAG: ISAs1 family transposase [Cyanobacteria bacterium J06626_6]
MTLIEVLKTAPEFRSTHGRFHQLWFVLLLLIVAAGSGYWGYRPAAEFAQRYGETVCEYLGLPVPRQMPSYSTFRRVMLGLDFTAFAKLFNRWAIDYVGIEAGELLASDGKSIRGSITNYDSAQQDFILLVSLFSQQRQQVVCALPMRNKHTGEEQTVRQMLAALDLRGAVVSMDALHTKKHWRPSTPVMATT